jgi:hypothetical protein
MTTFDTWDDVPKTREAKTVTDYDTDLSTQQKLLAAQKNLSYILKDARNDFAKYDYVGVDSYILACRTALLDVDLVLTRCFTFDRSDMTVMVIFTLMNPDTDDSDGELHTVVLPVVARAGMPEDKATLAAVSTATSYFLQGLFMLPRLDKTPELDEIDDRVKATTSQEAPMPEDLYLRVEELQDVLSDSGKEVTIKELMKILRGRAKDSGKTLDAAFVTTCIDKAKGKNQ